jgi:hypothetical protein
MLDLHREKVLLARRSIWSGLDILGQIFSDRVTFSGYQKVRTNFNSPPARKRKSTTTTRRAAEG